MQVLTQAGVIVVQHRTTGHEPELPIHPAIAFSNPVDLRVNRTFADTIEGRTASPEAVTPIPSPTPSPASTAGSWWNLQLRAEHDRA